MFAIVTLVVLGVILMSTALTGTEMMFMVVLFIHYLKLQVWDSRTWLDTDRGTNDDVLRPLYPW